jgi:ATP-dependent Lon protease
MPVGGIKMKVLAAHRAGLTTVILPKRNERDLDELPDEVRGTMTFIPVERIDEALQVALMPLGASHADHTNGSLPREKAEVVLN